ncbi:MAG: hypothetical protein ACLUNS_00375 [Alistipes shahii]
MARAVAKSELELVQIFARNAERARVVAELAATGWETRPEMLRKDADIYLIAVSDRAVAEVAATLPIPEEAAVAHTAGSVPVTAIPNDSPGVPFSIRCRPSPEGAKRTFP